jgi:transposase-like protein
MYVIDAVLDSFADHFRTYRYSIRIWIHKFSSIFRPSRRVRMLVAVDETVLKVNGQICYLWAAIDVDTNEMLAVYASRGRGIPSAAKFAGEYWNHAKVTG